MGAQMVTSKREGVYRPRIRTGGVPVSLIGGWQGTKCKDFGLTVSPDGRPFGDDREKGESNPLRICKRFSFRGWHKDCWLNQ